MPEQFPRGFARRVGEGESSRELTLWQARDHMMEHAVAARLHVDMVVIEQGTVNAKGPALLPVEDVDPSFKNGNLAVQFEIEGESHDFAFPDLVRGQHFDIVDSQFF